MLFFTISQVDSGLSQVHKVRSIMKINQTTDGRHLSKWTFPMGGPNTFYMADEWIINDGISDHPYSFREIVFK